MNVAPHLFWITSRAAGGAALLLASASVVIGLMMSSKRTASNKRDLRAIHEALSLATLGMVALHGLALLGLTYYLRDRIGPARWRRLHRLTAVFWLLAVVHTIWAGSDAAQWWFLIAAGALVTPAALLLALRWLARASGDPGSSARPVRRSAGASPSLGHRLGQRLPAQEQSRSNRPRSYP